MLGTVAKEAVKRYLRDPSGPLFNDDERERLAEALAATNATAELLGRSRIRLRMKQDGHKSFSEATDFSCFDDRPLHPLAPLEALDYFRSLIPLPGIDDPGRWADDHHRVGFTLARQTEEELLERVQRFLSGVLETGQAAGAEKRLGQILDEVGVTPRNPAYAEMVYRTNMMDSYTQGATAEMQDPDVADYFPVWQYLGIRDGRQGKDHEPHFDRYYPNGVSFAEVRGDRPFNCRCSFRPVDMHEWAGLQQRGVRLARA